VPPYPGLFSALGLLLADTQLDYVESLERALPDVTAAALASAYASLERQAAGDASRHGIDVAALRIDRTADLRYGFQQNDLTVDVPDHALRDPAILGNLYRAAYEREFGHPGEGVVNVVNVRIRARRPEGRVQLSDLRADAAGATAGSPSMRPVF